MKNHRRETLLLVLQDGILRVTLHHSKAPKPFAVRKCRTAVFRQHLMAAADTLPFPAARFL